MKEKKNVQEMDMQIVRFPGGESESGAYIFAPST